MTAYGGGSRALFPKGLTLSFFKLQQDEAPVPVVDENPIHNQAESAKKTTAQTSIEATT